MLSMLKGRPSLLAVGAGLSIIVGLSSVSQPSRDVATTSAEVAMDESSGEQGVRSDSVSAMFAARASGQRVEDLSQRTEETRVYAESSGSWTSETASEPEQVQDDDGSWHAVDTTLVERDGRLVPRYAATDVGLSAGQDRTFASVTAKDGTAIEWRWPSVLPEPTVTGDTATYAGAVPDGDLIVTAHATGFSHLVVLHEQPTEPIALEMPVQSQGAELVELPGGGLEIQADAGGEPLVSASAPLMWDSSTGESGESENVAPVDATVSESAAGATTLTLSPDEGFLADPDTVYPVVVDPSFTTFTTGDTWIQNADYTTSQVGSHELRAGSYDGGGHVARSFIDFNTNAWDGKHVTKATLRLKNFYSGSCTGSAIRAARINTPWSGSTLTWGNQPGAGTLLYDDYGPAHGYSASCESQDAVWDVADIVDSWAQGRAENHGIRLRAVDEGSIYSWRKYRSGNYDDGPNARPKLVVTYNSFPNTAGTPTVAPANAGYVTSLTPTLKSVVADPDDGTVRARFEVRRASDGVLLWTGTSAYVSSGGTASVTVPSGELANGGRYTVTVKGSDGLLDSKNWSTAKAFNIDLSYVDGVPLTPSNVHVKTDAMAPLVAATLTGASADSSVRMKVEVLTGGNVAGVYFSEYVESGRSSFVEIGDLQWGTYTARVWADNGLRLSDAPADIATLTVGIDNGEPPSMGTGWTPAPQKLDAAPPGDLIFTPSLPGGFTMELDSSSGLIRVLDAGGTHFGSYFAIGFDFHDQEVPATISVSGGQLRLTLSPGAEHVYPILTGPVFEELQ